MRNQFSDIRWGRVLLAGLVVSVLSLLVVTLVITAYGFILGIQTRGAPDQARIEQFANQVGPCGGPVLALLLTLVAAAWVARKVEAATSLHGVLVGLVVAIIGLIVPLTFGGMMGLLDLVWFVLTVAAGGLGGVLGSRGR